MTQSKITVITGASSGLGKVTPRESRLRFRSPISS